MNILKRIAVIMASITAGTVAAGEDLKNSGQFNNFDYAAVKQSGQIPLCMIGDSITWAEKGDCWRKELLARLPNLAFVGTHTAMHGYSHAGEGGNSTGQILGRMKYIPDCPYYSILIGTNNNGVKKAELIEGKSKQTADEIIKIVNELLKKKKGVEKVFLSSVLPCATDNPFRDQCNSATNKILREKFDSVFPKDKVVWVEYETPIRQVQGWEKKIFLHPNEEGYALAGGITAKAISSALNVKPGTESVRPANTGVQVVNLMGDNNITACPVIAGWYILSCKVDAVTGQKPEIILAGQRSGKNTFKQAIPVKMAGETITANVFTNYEGYGYTRDFLELKANGCTVSNVLLEKMRPSKKASIYGKDSYIDTVSPVSQGELLEYSK